MDKRENLLSLKSFVTLSDDGLTIGGKGINPEGKEEAWIARLASGCGFVSSISYHSLASRMTAWISSTISCTAACDSGSLNEKGRRQER